MARAVTLQREVSAPVAGHRVARGFHVGMSSFLLLMVLLGFAPTWLLTPVVGTSHLPAGQQGFPWHVHVHGLLMTAWYALLLTQSLLAASGRGRFHRRLGLFAFTLAVPMVAFAALTVVRFAQRYFVGGFPEPPDTMPPIIAGDFAELLLFTTFAVGAFHWRRESDAHQRLVLLASISFIGPAMARVGGLLMTIACGELATNGQLASGQADPRLVSVVGVSGAIAVPLLVMALALHDWTTRRRVHPVTLWGGLLAIAVSLAGTRFGAASAGRALVNALAPNLPR